ncbi:hypothetical protein TREMEDRAFT_63177 [Tremella mesenterica DSM 1558]|uniref:uncharacterized protein n=1 Tax=Tremella mesenterica (strain ATCC 24925 / CBS 8224 / DSM 1558 / NBRC 9311 / NRRL Y-6157 / RJB 2259-6 / UBC 559-6) TaxID=578456 RepID=UPI0003F49602|nr:uncharacterized protein TREMEDRAFT_63177 [Tremella mesenterica DSM 1558]EIW68714.1 hypothetical protein TREMEDRAFT_63177 [Tremella mesenterica DSM 1558]
MAIVVHSPTTPSGLMETLALSPIKSAVPTITLFPPTPDRPPSPIKIDLPPPKSVPHRPLASNEARQLTLLLTQHLWPIRTSSKGMMRESIALAEKLHEAGVRWDKHRRVMGMHLRGIWEEGQRLGNARMPGGMSPMEPIPIEVHPGQFAALPKLTLQAGIGLTGQFHNSSETESRNIEIIPQTPLTAATVMTTLMPSPVPKKERRRWKDKKKEGLKIKVDSHRKPRVGAVAIQQPFTAASVSGFGHLKRFAKLKLRMKLRKTVYGLPKSARRPRPTDAGRLGTCLHPDIVDCQNRPVRRQGYITSRTSLRAS